ncbi:flagellar biosynthesis protein FlhB [Brevirhabdus sp.]|uniref:flagellar biosynthesis protein FlhB n=1 Tax=Brevirhabdus sp. TaxID=2004514 RepID=UPI0040598856
MAEDTEDKQNKTEEPTERKLQKAREKGDVASSREAGNLMSVLSLFAIVAYVMPAVGAQLVGTLRGALENAGQLGIGQGQGGVADLGGIGLKFARGIAATLSPVLALMVVGALVGVALQGEVVVAAERLKPKLSKVSPFAGLKRLFSAQTLVEFVKSVVKVLVVGAIALGITWQAVQRIWQTQGLLPEAVASYARTEAAKILVATLILVAFIALVDILWKRFDWRRKQRMSIKDIRDEHKDTEGDPQIKGRRAEMRRARARQRIAQAVPRATLVLTNPTHFAVALRYEAGESEAPVCVAKGTDLMAAQIRKLAHEAEVPVVENRPLARALYDAVEVDRQIPLEHWEAVAAVIGYVMDLKRNIRRKPTDGSVLRED